MHRCNYYESDSSTIPDVVVHAIEIKIMEEEKKAYLEIERERLQLEKNRQALEEKRQKEDKGFFPKPLGVFLTFLASFAAVVVSASQVWVAFITKDAELQSQRLENKSKLDAEELQNRREFNLKVVQFVTEHQDEIFSADDEKRNRMKDVILVTFPEELTAVLFRKLERAAEVKKAPGQQETWRQGQEDLRIAEQIRIAENSKFKISYYGLTSSQEEHNAIKEYLQTQGYNIVRADQISQSPGSWFAPTSTVFYYDSANISRAGEIARELEKITGIHFNVQQGAGRGVPEDERNIYIIIHYRDY